jgi:zinc protease
MRRPLIFLTVGAASALGSAHAQTPTEKPPAPGPLRPYSVPAVQSFTLPNGVRVALIEKHTLPIVTARIRLDAGAVREPADKSGVAVLTASLLSEGAAGMTGAQIADTMAALGAQYGTTGSFGSAYANVTSLPTVFGEALSLAAKTIMNPTFTESDVNRLRASAIAAYERNQSTAEGVAAKIFSWAVFDPATPYARLSGGNKASLSTLTRDDVVKWHSTMYSPKNTTVMIVGDITPAQARTVVERALGSWNVPAPALPPLANRARQVSTNRIILVDRPGSVQSGVVIGQAADGWESPDVIPLQAAAQVLGGGFGSRINMNLREKHGWTYGAFASFGPLQQTGTFSVNSAIRTNATDSAIAEGVREFRRLASEPVTNEELSDQLANVIASFPNSVQTVQGLLNNLATIVTYSLPLNYYSTYRERLAAVTPADISRLGKTKLSPSALTIVAVGDLKTIEAPIRALNLGSVEVWDNEGNKIR